jgi:hypothetical protein
MQYDVLISYSAQEREMVERLAAYLEHYNVTCFVAHRDIPADVAWANGIAAAIEMSRMAVVVYSDSYNSAPWMNRELASVGASGIPVVTMCLTSAPYSEDKAEYLRGTTCVAAIGNAEDAFPMVYEQVCNMFGMPIEVVLHPSEVLKEKLVAPQEPVAAEQQAVVKKNEVKKQEPKNEEVKEENVVSQPVQKKSHHLLEAFIVGIVLAGAVVALMELLLK